MPQEKNIPENNINSDLMSAINAVADEDASKKKRNLAEEQMEQRRQKHADVEGDYTPYTQQQGLVGVTEADAAILLKTIRSTLSHFGDLKKLGLDDFFGIDPDNKRKIIITGKRSPHDLIWNALDTGLLKDNEGNKDIQKAKDLWDLLFMLIPVIVSEKTTIVSYASANDHDRVHTHEREDYGGALAHGGGVTYAVNTKQDETLGIVGARVAVAVTQDEDGEVCAENGKDLEEITMHELAHASAYIYAAKGYRTSNAVTISNIVRRIKGLPPRNSTDDPHEMDEDDEGNQIEVEPTARPNISEIHFLNEVVAREALRTQFKNKNKSSESIPQNKKKSFGEDNGLTGAEPWQSKNIKEYNRAKKEQEKQRKKEQKERQKQQQEEQKQREKEENFNGKVCSGESQNNQEHNIFDLVPLRAMALINDFWQKINNNVLKGLNDFFAPQTGNRNLPEATDTNKNNTPSNPGTNGFDDVKIVYNYQETDIDDPVLTNQIRRGIVRTFYDAYNTV